MLCAVIWEDFRVIWMKSGRNSVPMVVGVMGKRVKASYTLDLRLPRAGRRRLARQRATGLGFG